MTTSEMKLVMREMLEELERQRAEAVRQAKRCKDMEKTYQRMRDDAEQLYRASLGNRTDV
ncbi:hypothetical protein KIN_16870 [Litoreibacter roseus]|uniref:Uncharacterized protein n=1 Tax=Litoreibacter roseus TaxID=2601869 RepID=A0A6N6JE42_9RHOB|nr:hypothetical protein KIN_16870 [Litoreibacter roseus]